MSKTGEIILTTEGTGELWSACVWDPSTGAALMTYKGANAAGPRGACLLGNDYILLTDMEMPVLNAWPVNSPNPVKSVKLNCTGRVNAMAVTPNGCFCVTGVGRKLIVWQIASGVQLAVLVRHFQAVTCIKFTDDNTYFISGGADGQALVWHLPYVVSVLCGEVFPEQTEPRYTFSQHRLSIEDIHVGYGGIKGRFVTVSVDKTCRVYDLLLGQLVATFILSYSLSAVTMNPIESMLFVGAVNGKILQLDLCSLPRTPEHHVTDEEKVFVGHSKTITCLSISQDGTVLLSGSEDQQLILWDILSRENIRSIEHNGIITNAFFAMAPKQMFDREFDPGLVLCTFRDMPDEKEGYIIKVRTKEDHWRRLHPFDDLGAAGDMHMDESFEEEEEEEEIDESQMWADPELHKNVMEATQMNTELYKFAVDKVFKSCSLDKGKKKNKDKRVEAEGETSSSGDSKSLRKKEAQQKHKGIGKKSKKQPPSPK